MPDRPIRKGFNVLEEAEEIRNKRLTPQYHEEYIDSIKGQFISALRAQWHTGLPKYFASDIWRELLLKTRNYPKPEFLDDISELRQEVDTLKLMVKSLSKTIDSSNKTIDELSKEIRQKDTIRQIDETFLDRLCNAYIEKVSKIDIVKKIYVIETNNTLTCWTITETEPFDSTLLEPIYDAQVKIYKEIKEDLVLDFHVLNLSELYDSQELDIILPPSAKLIWQR